MSAPEQKSNEVWSADRSDRLWALFDQAADLPPAEQQALLAAACADDLGLRAEVERLLAQDARLEAAREDIFLESPLVRSTATRPVGEEPIPPIGMAPLPTYLGRYRVIRLLGEGGMGAVYEAEQESPRRAVALKVVRPGLVSPSFLKRFRHEAQILGRLHHPGIAQVYEAGLAKDGQPYFAMEFIRGQTLDEYARLQAPTLQDWLELLARVCDAVQHAHDQGVIHRDLKPANILVEATGQPKVLDFGVARATAADLLTSTGLTQTGQLVGTPNYMSPEQARGDNAQVGPAADVYALGSILYELLTGRKPFEGAGVDVLIQVQTDEPIPPRRLNPRLAADLDTIALKCLEKESSQRYGSAAALAEDLRLFRAGKPIHARPIGPCGRAWRWARRQPAIASLLALVAVLTVAGFGLVGWQWYEANQARGWADKSAAEERRARLDEEAARHRAQAMSAGLALDQGMGLCREGKIGAGLLWMARALELLPTGEDDLDYAIRANLAAWKGHFSRHRWSPHHGAAVTTVAFSPDGKSVLVGHWGNAMGKPGPAQAQLYDPATWKPRLGSPVRHNAAIWGSAFSPDGRTFATASFDNTARQWHTASGQPTVSPLQHRGSVFAVAYRPDGKVLATVARIVDPANPSGGSEVYLWDAATGQPVRAPIPLAHLYPRGLAWSPDGKTLAVGGGLPVSKSVSGVGGRVVLLDADTGQQRGIPLVHAETVTAVAFHPGGEMLATASEDGVARFWDARSQVRQKAVLRHPYPLTCMAFCREGLTLATGGGQRLAVWRGQGEVRIWDVATAQELVQPLVHYDYAWTAEVHAVAFSPDRSQLVTASENGYAWLWPIATLTTPLARAQLEEKWASDLTFAPKGDHFLVCTRRPGNEEDVNRPSEVRLWRTNPTLSPGPVLTLPTACVQGPVFSPDGRTVLTISHPDCREHRLQLWDSSTGKALAVPPTMSEGVTCAAWGKEGRTVLVGGTDGQARLWDSATFVSRGPPLAHGTSLRFVALAPDEATGLTAGVDGKIRLWALPEGNLLAELPAPPANLILKLAEFTAGGQVIVTLCRIESQDERLSVVNCWGRDGMLLGPPQVSKGKTELQAWHPAGKSFLTTEHNGTGLPIAARLWDPLSGRVLGQPVAFPFSHGAAAFHPSGRFIGLGEYHQNARLWSVMAGKQIGPPVPHPGQVHELDFSADGRTLVTLGADSSLRLWKVTAAVEGSPAEVQSLVTVLTGQELRDDEPRDLPSEELENRRKRLASAGVDWPP